MRRIKSLFCAAGAAVLLGVAPAVLAGEPASYDAELAEALGADEYGMRSYVFVMLKTGPAEITDADVRAELFASHFANMSQLAEEGKLVLAGPLMEAGDNRGILVLNADSIEAAQGMVAGDAAVTAGIFTAEYYRYYGSAALMQLNDIHSRIQKTIIE